MSEIIGRSLYEQRVVIRRNNGTRISVTAVEANPETAAAAVGNDLTGIGHKPVYRVFRRNTTLNRIADTLDCVLAFNADFLAVQSIAFSHFNLCLDNVDTRNHFRNRVFYLYTRVNFDKVEFFIICHEELNRTRVDIIDILHQFQRRIANIPAQLRRQRERRRNFYNLLMTPLNGAVPFKEVNDIAVFVTHDLNFYVLRIDNTFFQVDFIVAESELRFGLSAFICFLEVGHFVDHTHPAATATINGFKHNRQAHFFGKAFYFGIIHNGAVAAGDKLNTRFFSLNTGIDLVAEHDKMFHLRTDKDDTFFMTPFSKFRIFREESVTRMNSINFVFMGDANNIFNIQICVNRFLTLTDQVRFIGTETVQ